MLRWTCGVKREVRIINEYIKENLWVAKVGKNQRKIITDGMKYRTIKKLNDKLRGYNCVNKELGETRKECEWSIGERHVKMWSHR